MKTREQIKHVHLGRVVAFRCRHAVPISIFCRRAGYFGSLVRVEKENENGGKGFCLRVRFYQREMNDLLSR